VNTPSEILTQRATARWVGALYLLTMAAAVLSEMLLKRGLIAPGDAAQTAQNLLAHPHRFRWAVVCDLLTALGVTGIIAGLYTLLRPVQAPLARLAVLWRLTENALSYVAVALSMIGLWFLRDTAYLDAFTESQQQVLTRFFLYAQAEVLSLVFIPLGVGSACFAVALRRSGYIPGGFALYGLAASLLLAMVSLTVIVGPALGQWQLLLMLPMGLYEVSLGLYLVLGFARISAK
jgi:hypothetical protein